MTEFNSSNLSIKNCSDELAEIFEYIENDLSKEIPTLILNSEYFILGVLRKKKSVMPQVKENYQAIFFSYRPLFILRNCINR